MWKGLSLYFISKWFEHFSLPWRENASSLLTAGFGNIKYSMDWAVKARASIWQFLRQAKMELRSEFCICQFSRRLIGPSHPEPSFAAFLVWSQPFISSKELLLFTHWINGLNKKLIQIFFKRTYIINWAHLQTIYSSSKVFKKLWPPRKQYVNFVCLIPFCSPPPKKLFE